MCHQQYCPYDRENKRGAVFFPSSFWALNMTCFPFSPLLLVYFIVVTVFLQDISVAFLNRVCLFQDLLIIIFTFFFGDIIWSYFPCWLYRYVHLALMIICLEFSLCTWPLTFQHRLVQRASYYVFPFSCLLIQSKCSNNEAAKVNISEAYPRGFKGSNVLFTALSSVNNFFRQNIVE